MFLAVSQRTAGGFQIECNSSTAVYICQADPEGGRGGCMSMSTQARMRQQTTISAIVCNGFEPSDILENRLVIPGKFQFSLEDPMTILHRRSICLSECAGPQSTFYDFASPLYLSLQLSFFHGKFCNLH